MRTRATIVVVTAMLLAAGTASAGLVVNIGNGADGDLVIPTGQTVTWGAATSAVSTPLAMPTQAGSSQIVVGSTAGFSPGDEVVLYVYQAQDETGAAGQYQTFNVADVQGAHGLTLNHAPSAIYDTSKQVVAVQRVPNFNNVTVEGTMVAAPWSGTGGGLIFFRAKGTLDIAGQISAAGRGFSGGVPFQGDTASSNGRSPSLDSIGGGGAAATGMWLGGGGGSLCADPTFTHLCMGSGGGGAGSSSFGPGGAGANGGGLIYAAASKISLTGSIDVSGDQWGSGGRAWGSGWGGGGSGGEVWLQCWDASDMTAVSINRNGGVPPWQYYTYTMGGAGGTGLSRLDFHYGPVPYAGADVTETVDIVVPEPMTLSLLALTGLALIRRGRMN